MSSTNSLSVKPSEWKRVFTSINALIPYLYMGRTATEKESSADKTQPYSFSESDPSSSSPAPQPLADDTPKPWRLWKVLRWFYVVFLKRRPYIPGDSCRYFWQKTWNIDGRFVAYRASYAFCHSLILLISFFHVFSDCPPTKGAAKHWVCFGRWMGVTHSWPFYMTRWGIMLNFVQSLMAVAIIVRAYRCQIRGNDNPYATSSEHSLLTLTGLTWALHTHALIFAIHLDVAYWILINEPQSHPLGYVTVLAAHLFNLLYLAIDHCVIASPVLFSHVIVVILFPAVYTLINYVYYASGGMDFYNEHHYLYAFMNWTHPDVCFLSAIKFTTSSFLFLLILLLIDHFKFRHRPPLLKENESLANQLETS